MRSITKFVLYLTLLAATSVSPAWAQSFQLLADFTPDSGMPRAALLAASDGYLYGTTLMGGTFGMGAVYRIRPDGTGYETVYSFRGSNDGGNPNGELVEYAGNLYGVTSGGGGNGGGMGVVFQLDLASPFFVNVVHSFAFNNPNHGATPTGGLLVWNGVLYGTAQSGGAHDQGVVFAIDPLASPATFAVLHAFDQSGRNPLGTLVEADGLLYGVTQWGGQLDGGTIFRLDPLTGVTQTVADLGYYPHAGLVKVGTQLYGTTQQGGNNGGSVFRFDTTTDALDYIFFFDPTPPNAAYPVAALVHASNGKLYGTTEGGGAHGHGTVFEIDITTDPVTLVVIHSFDPALTGSRPSAALVQAGGLLYGTASTGGPGFDGTVFSFNPGSGTTARLHAFGPTEIHQPLGDLVESGGVLFGASMQGGPLRGGTVFRWDPQTTNTTILHSFDPDTEGLFPQASIIRGSDGRLYGTTWIGGPTSCGPGCTTQYGGMVFRMDDNGSNFTILKSFDSAGGAPFAPYGRLLETNGTLFGTLAAGGAHNGGAVFAVGTDGSAYQVLRDLDPAVEGTSPTSGLTRGTDGLLYGTASLGGQYGSGTAFRMDTSGGNFEVLHAFNLANPLDAARPEPPLVQMGPTLFMGTTTTGGLYSGGGMVGGGIVYRIDVSTTPATFTVLTSFENCCPSPNGTAPQTLVKGAGGWAYGTAVSGGAGSVGTLFAINTNGAIRLLHTFTIGDGIAPSLGLTIDPADGSLYGATRHAGPRWGGVLFRLRLDADNDGVRDPLDNCPTFANPLQADSDGNGIGDGCPVVGAPRPAARLTLGQMNFTYDGTPKATSVTTVPIEAAQTGVLTVTYNGSTTPPTDAGAYTVVASLNNPGYTTADATGLLTIGRGTPIITWNNPVDIFYPTPLSATQLNATSNVAGTFTYTPAAGDVLPMGYDQVLSVTFTPSSPNYNPASASVQIDVVGLTVVDSAPPVVLAMADISVLATHATGATGQAVFYPWAGKPLPTLNDFLNSAIATDDVSTPVPLPTELRNCITGIVLDPLVHAATSFPIGAGINCVRFSFRDAAGNVGSVTRQVTVLPGSVTTPGGPMTVQAIGTNGLPTGVTVSFDGGVTGAGTTAAACYRNASSTTQADFLFDSRPVWPECGTLPDGTPRQCSVPSTAFGTSYTISCDVSTTAQYQGVIKVCFPHLHGRDTLWHFNATTGLWEDITIRPVQANQPICGFVTSLSPFIINATPELGLPSAVTVEATSASGGRATYSVTATDPEEGDLATTCDRASGSLFALGTTPVTCSATDGSGATEIGSFPVHVVDTTAPVVTAPGGITVVATQSGGASGATSPALASWLTSATAADLVDPAPTGGAQATNATIVPVGTTAVTFRFVDNSGNAGIATSTVTVINGPPHVDVSIIGRGPVSGTKQYVDLSFSNTGGGVALKTVAVVVPITAQGYGVVKVVSPSQPLLVGDLAPGATKTIRVVLNVPTTVKEILLVEAGLFWNPSGTPLGFTDSQRFSR